MNTTSRHILITGATGFIGRHLVERLVERGDRVSVLARNAAKARRLFGTRAAIVTDLAALPSGTRLDAIVNLAGESIAGGLWTKARRAALLGSRLGVTGALRALVERLEVKPATWVNASAIGYYGAQSSDEALHEKSPPGRGFQADLCRQWEETAAAADALGTKVAVLRIGVVLGRDGGALPALARPVRWCVGTVLGSGAQWFSWIHLDDLLELVLFVLDQGTLAGPFNATAPTPVRHAELMTAIATALHRRLLPLAVPELVLRGALGELAELFVDGQRVVPERAMALGFRFRHATIEAALREIYGDGPGARAAVTRPVERVSGSR